MQRAQKHIGSLLKETVSRYVDNGGSLLAGALAFQSILSLAPLILIAVSVAGLAFGEDAASGQLQTYLAKYVGKTTAESVGSMVHGVRRAEIGGRATLLGFVVILYTASRLFGQLQDALNQLARVQVQYKSWKTGVWMTLYRQGMAVLLVLGGGAVFTVVLLATAVATALKQLLQDALPGSEFIWQFTPLLSTLVFVWAVFTVIYRLMPDVRVAWFDAAVGGALGASLFCVAEWPLSVYLGRQGVTSAFGAASSLVIFLLWVYYSAQIFFIGAQFTWVLAEANGRTEPAPTVQA